MWAGNRLGREGTSELTCQTNSQGQTSVLNVPTACRVEPKEGGGEVPFCSAVTKRPVFLSFSMLLLPGTFECYLEKTENRWQASKGTWDTPHIHFFFFASRPSNFKLVTNLFLWGLFKNNF